MHALRVFSLFTVLGLVTSCTPDVDPDAASDPPPAAPAPAAPPARAGAEARTPPSLPSMGAPVRVAIEGLPTFGSPRALVTVVAFVDYACPYCAKADGVLASLRSDLGDDLRLVVAHRPLPMHPRAKAAARAQLAAAEQGKGAEMHARLFADPTALDDAGLQASARALGLDVTRFEAARHGAETGAALEKSLALAGALGAKGTPTFYVNGRRLVGAWPHGQFRQVLDEARAEAQALVARGVPRHRVYEALMAAASPPAADKPESAGAPAKRVHVNLEEAPIRGRAGAPVTIAVFADFECPYSAKVERTLRALEAEVPGKVRVAFRHLPLPMHEHARLAAKAAIAADAQGRFWPYHDLLVAHPDALDRVSLREYAAEVGLDLASFERDLDDPKTEARLAADEREAARLHVRGTPVAYVNGRRVNGAQPLATFRRAFSRALTEP